MYNPLRALLKWILRTLLTVLVLSVISFFVFTDKHPQVEHTTANYLNDAETVYPLLNDLKRILAEDHLAHSVRVTHTQFASLLDFLRRALPGFEGQVSLQAGEGKLILSYAFTVFAHQRYINLTLVLQDAPKVDIKQLKVSKVPLPGNLLLDVVSWGIDRYTQSNIATLARQQVANVLFLPREAHVRIQPMQGFMAALKEAKNQLNLDRDEALIVRVTYYLYFLAYEQSIPVSKQVSLGEYIRELMLEAQIQSKPNTAHLENEAALLALAIYAGDARFARFIGIEHVAQDRLLPAGITLTVQNRADLAKHFIYSAAIQILSDQGISVAIGEFKELMDRVQTGSGYSFVDLAADKAGVQFAVVLANPDRAAQAQLLLSLQVDETIFMPSTNGLPEGLHREAFVAQFGRVDSPAYVAMVETVRQRVLATPLNQQTQ